MKPAIEPSESGGSLPTWVPDVTVALIVTVGMIVVTAFLDPAGGQRRADALGLALVAVAGMAAAVVRRWPRSMLGVIAIAVAVYVARGYPNGPIFALGWIAIFWVSRLDGRRAAVAGAAGLCVALGIATAIAGTASATVVLVFVAWSLVAGLLGDVVRTRRQTIETLEDRARFLERSREDEARRRIAEDRLSIARDLHDSVAHAMATINVQAGAAAHVIDRRPEAAREALEAIQRASGEVLDELGSMLTLLRSDGATGGGSDADLQPTPGLERLGDLVKTAGEAHLDVELRTSGDLAVVERPRSIAAYRIVQESLTNVARHSGATHVSVSVTGSAGGALVLEVVDPGPAREVAAAHQPAGGYGIVGMRERVASTHGRLEVGRRPGGGFGVRATWGEVA